MPGELTTVGAGKALDAVNGRATQTARNTYVALLTAAATDANIISELSEVTTAGYARQQATWGAPSGDPQVAANTNAMTFGPFTADPPNVTHLALVSSASGTSGDLLYRWQADTARDGITNDSITIAIGALTMSLD